MKTDVGTLLGFPIVTVEVPSLNVGDVVLVDPAVVRKVMTGIVTPAQVAKQCGIIKGVRSCEG